MSQCVDRRDFTEYFRGNVKSLGLALPMSMFSTFNQSVTQALVITSSLDSARQAGYGWRNYRRNHWAGKAQDRGGALRLVLRQCRGGQSFRRSGALGRLWCEAGRSTVTR